MSYRHAVPEALSTKGRSLLGEWRLLIRIAILVLFVWIAKRVLSLPRLLRLMDARASRSSEEHSDELERAIRLTRGVTTRLFGGGCCMERSLVDFHLLRRWGRPARVHFGVTRRGGELVGHAWVSLDGQPFEEPDDPRDEYTTTFAYPHHTDNNNRESL